MDLGLAGQKAFITGGNAGIGFAIAQALVSEGASVGICARDRSHVDKAVAALREEGGKAVGVVADVTVPSQLKRAIDQIIGELGGLDLLVTCVGGDVGQPWLMENTSEDWSATFQLNVVHSADAVRAAVPYLRKSGRGSVLFISSITGWRPGPTSQYAASKAALIHLAATLALELGPYGIRVNALSPGSVGDTDGWKEYRQMNPKVMEAFEKEEFPLHRMVTTQEVADVACLVLSPRGSGLNGANITVDAGQFRPHAIRFPSEV
ncbi:MAG: SDR family oxidoreductase [Thermoplasmata archaeon]|nr:SDR family oxidoreductase [Thermoplasmata archaeon]